MSFKSVLVANRGEIALRVMRSVRAAGMQCIAVYTDADAEAPHVAFADRAVRIGVGPVAESYLSITRILAAAAESVAEAVHPGYGFLSENADFARACGAAGLVFIGPSADAIAVMGNKAAAKRKMIAAGVPCVPGYEGADQSDAAFVAAADQIGFPVMVKAAAGGGGRGMRLVAEASGLVDALGLARSEAANAFGSGALILERAVVDARHVEVQIFADRSGHTVHLGERDCSVQRRHQKVVEEAPCPVMREGLRAEMGAAAVAAARAVSYQGAGTVEFLLDGSGGFYFLEMNTRLQVEHPVTELVTGRDLVALQLRVAAGEPLGFAQDDVRLEGHAIEVRLYGEDPSADFLPATGVLQLWEPGAGEGVRVDSGVVAGQEISPFYDPMLAKIMAFGATRDQARMRLIAALKDTAVFGVRTNRDFLIDVLGRQRFADGAATTAFIALEYPDGVSDTASFAEMALGAVLIRDALATACFEKSLSHKALVGWSSSGVLRDVIRLGVGDVVHKMVLALGRDGCTTVTCGADRVVIDRGLRVDGVRSDLGAVLFDGGAVHFNLGARSFRFVHVTAIAALREVVAADVISAPMHGNLQAVLVSVGDVVAAGDRVAILEAMKMQHELRAGAAGTVVDVRFAAGTQVKVGDVLVRLEISK
jgi:geranyl-CoA carboxylase alpha subunit